MTVLLAFDLTQRRACVALTKETASHVRALQGQSAHGDEVFFTELDALLLEAGVAKEEIGVGAVAVGPGSFTGLRVSIAAAKGIATALGLRVLAVPSAFVEAQSLRAAKGTQASIVALASKQGSAWFTACVYRDGRWSALVEGSAGGVETLDRCATALKATGCSLPIALIHDEHLDATLLSAATRMSLVSEPARADGIALLSVAREFLDADESLDPMQLLPIYPREPEAVTIWNARHTGG